MEASSKRKAEQIQANTAFTTLTETKLKAFEGRAVSVNTATLS